MMTVSIDLKLRGTVKERMDQSIEDHKKSGRILYKFLLLEEEIAEIGNIIPKGSYHGIWVECMEHHKEKHGKRS